MMSHLFRKRSLYFPTWKLMVLLLVLGGGLLVFILRSLYPFLAISNATVRPDVIVIDGWVSDQTFVKAIAIAKEENCDLILATGVELAAGYHLSEYKTYAHLGEATLEALGVPADQAHAAPGGSNHRHRTFASASAVYQWLEKSDLLGARLTIVTEGPHSRRSLAVYRKVFQHTKTEIGIHSLPPVSYDPDSWWTTSAGVKSVIVESIALTDEWLRDGGRSTNDPH